MYFKLLALLSVPLCSGLFLYTLPALSPRIFNFLLIFGGSYLFSFLLVHLLPELFAEASPTTHTGIGIFLLLGFFLQLFLDFFSGGIAHGHIDELPTHFYLGKSVTLLIALCIHALLDGFLLNLPEITHAHHYHSNSLLIGILLHKIPISFILTTMLIHLQHSKKTIFFYLLIFSMASPIGWAISHHLQHYHFFSLQGLTILRAIAIGNLLHIATTILFESSPQHHFNSQKLLVILVGAILATITSL